jgi:hypothetical protein
MYKRTTTFSLPEGSTSTHYVHSSAHCESFSTVYPEDRLYGDRYLSEDGRDWTTIQIWSSREAYTAYTLTPAAQEEFKLRNQYNTTHGITRLIVEEDI